MIEPYQNFPNRRWRRRRFFFFPFIAAAALLLFGAIVMYLWNAILPEVTSVHPITFWQAIGLLVLSRILFGGFGGGRWRGGRRHMHRGGPHFREKWMRMNDEERARFRAEWRERCGRRGRMPGNGADSTEL